MKPTSTAIAHLFRGARPFTVACALGGLLFASSAQAEEAEEADWPISTVGDLATRFRVNDDDPAASIPTEEQRNNDALEFGYWLQDMVARAETAHEKKDWAGVVKYYDALRQAIPQQVMSYRRLCKAQRELGQTEAALDNCFEALTRENAVVQDHLAFLDLLLAQPALGPEAVEQAKASLTHLREHARLHPQALPGEEPVEVVKQPTEWTEEERKADPKKWLALMAQEKIEESAGKPAAATSSEKLHLPTQIEIFSCRLGVLTSDAPRLSECVGRLRSYKFPTALLVPFVWAQAVAEGDAQKADGVLALAKQEGLPDAAIAMMREEQARVLTAHSDSAGTSATLWLPIAGALVLALIAFVVVRRRGGGSTTQPG